MNTRKTVKGNLRRLKKNGERVTIVSAREESDFDVVSGKQVVKKKQLVVRKAIPMPASTLRKFFYDLDYIAANNNFTQGGYFDVTMRFILIDGGDLKGFVPAIDDEMIVDRVRYGIKEIKPTDFNLGFIFRIEAVGGIKDVFTA